MKVRICRILMLLAVVILPLSASQTARADHDDWHHGHRHYRHEHRDWNRYYRVRVYDDWRPRYAYPPRVVYRPRPVRRIYVPAYDGYYVDDWCNRGGYRFDDGWWAGPIGIRASIHVH